MAERPVFIPSLDAPGLVRTLSFRFVRSPGFALAQKRRNIRALHESAAKSGYSPSLEISTKSDEELGRQLSAFSLNSPWQKCHFLDRRILPIRAGDSRRESFRIFPSGAIGRVEPREGGPEAQKRVSKLHRRSLERPGLADAVEFAHQ